MQAHPLSNPAARIPSTSSPASPRTLPQAAIPTTSHTPLCTRVQPFRKSSSNLSGKPDPLSGPPVPTLAGTVGLAHDAGNLLGALGLYCDLLSAPGVLRPEHRRYAVELSVISNRSSELIRRLLAMPSATAPISTPAFTHNHASMLQGLAPVLQRMADGAATVSVTCPASLPPLDFPSEIIERIIINLVCNAVEAIRSRRGNIHDERGNPHNGRRRTSAAAFPAHGEIHVTLAILSSRLQLTVEDNGPGMPPAVAAAFLQPSPLPRKAARGLGHRIIHELATASGGHLSVRVRPGKGTTFCLKWPVPAPGHSARHSTPSMKTAQEGSSTC